MCITTTIETTQIEVYKNGTTVVSIMADDGKYREVAVVNVPDIWKKRWNLTRDVDDKVYGVRVRQPHMGQIGGKLLGELVDNPSFSHAALP